MTIRRSDSIAFDPFLTKTGSKTKQNKIKNKFKNNTPLKGPISCGLYDLTGLICFFYIGFYIEVTLYLGLNSFFIVVLNVLICF